MSAMPEPTPWIPIIVSLTSRALRPSQMRSACPLQDSATSFATSKIVRGASREYLGFRGSLAIAAAISSTGIAAIFVGLRWPSTPCSQ